MIDVAGDLQTDDEPYRRYYGGLTKAYELVSGRPWEEPDEATSQTAAVVDHPAQDFASETPAV